jgi:ABC-type branched-subunit amino acid transport system ATPase component
MMFALETVGLVKSFDGFVATKDLSLRVEAGTRHALIGPNGAGKTTDMDLVFRFADHISVLVSGAPWWRVRPSRSRAIPS